MNIGLGIDFGFVLVGWEFCSLVSFPLWIFRNLLVEGCLFHCPVWLVCSRGMLAGVEAWGKGRSEEDGLKAPQEA